MDVITSGRMVQRTTYQLLNATAADGSSNILAEIITK